MSWQLYDVNGYVADLATNSALVAMCEWAEANKDSMPNLSGFLTLGAALITVDLMDELADIILPNDAQLAATVVELIENVTECNTVAIISNGLSGDPSGEGLEEEEA